MTIGSQAVAKTQKFPRLSYQLFISQSLMMKLAKDLALGNFSVKQMSSTGQPLVAKPTTQNSCAKLLDQAVFSVNQFIFTHKLILTPTIERFPMSHHSPRSPRWVCLYEPTFLYVIGD